METEKDCCTAPPRESAARRTLALYRPLIVILAVAMLAAGALRTYMPFMRGVMGLFLLFLAALKLFNLKGFADSFMRYDVAAKRSRAYALAYPFIELGLGCLYLAGALPVVTGLLTIALMAVGTVGVAAVIRAREKLSCACIGAGFNLPVGIVTLLENIAMAAMGVMSIRGW